jgi:hypothetical protein
MCGGPTYPFSSLLRCWMSAQGHQKRSHLAWLQIRIALEATEGCWHWHNGSGYSCSYFSSWHRLWAWRRIALLLDQGMSENCGHYDRSRSTPEPSPRSLGLPVWISRRTNEQSLLPLLERRTDGRTDSVTLPTRRSKNSTRTDAFLPSFRSRAHEISISRRVVNRRGHARATKHWRFRCAEPKEKLMRMSRKIITARRRQRRNNGGSAKKGPVPKAAARSREIIYRRGRRGRWQAKSHGCP